MGRLRFTAAVLLATAGASLVPIITLGFTSGGGSGVSGGPAGYETGLGNCTACHEFNSGPGTVRLVGVPKRYRAGASYDLMVHVTDADAEQKGAGFEISAEGAGGHLGSLSIIDPVNTQYTASGGDQDYVTHTSDGVTASIGFWRHEDNPDPGSFKYEVQWVAPDVDVGPVTLFAAAEAINDAAALFGDRFYTTHATLSYAQPGDGDGDADVDLRDIALLQHCFGETVSGVDDQCQYLDLNDDNIVSPEDIDLFANAISGPTATLPAGYVMADAVRGGLLYDKWWVVAGVDAPAEDHPRWAMQDTNTRSGADTWRCKECHGWDYKGIDGAYGSGSHMTGFTGIFGTTLSAQDVFDKLETGHGFGDAGLSADDIWDLAKFVLDGQIDTDDHIDETGAFLGSELGGTISYDQVCLSCHGSDGKAINSGSAQDPVYVGTVANENPWEFLHKVRFGHPGSAMPATDLLRWEVFLAADVGVYAQTLSTN